jgi:hypothetical protein
MKRLITSLATILLVLVLLQIKGDAPPEFTSRLAELSSGATEPPDQMNGGTINGELFVAGTLLVEGPIVVDGQVVVGNQMSSPLGMAIITSAGNRDAEVPTDPAVRWRDSIVRGPLVIHGPMVITGSLYFINEIVVGGTMRSYCSTGLVFFPRGSYPFAQRINFNCGRS